MKLGKSDDSKRWLTPGMLGGDGKRAVGKLGGIVPTICDERKAGRKEEGRSEGVLARLFSAGHGEQELILGPSFQL